MDKNKRKTDKAWCKLHNRLQQEGLLFKEKPAVIFPWLKIAGGLAVFACLIYVLSFRTDSGTDSLKLFVNDSQETSTLVKTLEDGSIIYLTQKSSLQFPEHFASDKREVNLDGEAFFDVMKDKESPFYINAGQVRIEVLGTAFTVNSSSVVPFSLAVQRGKVKVTLKQEGQEVYVEAGESVTLQGCQLHVAPNDKVALFDHYFKKMRFKDENVEHILRVVNMNASGLKLKAATPLLGKRKLTIEIADNSPEIIAELICMALNLQCSRQGDNLILSE